MPDEPSMGGTVRLSRKYQAIQYLERLGFFKSISTFEEIVELGGDPLNSQMAGSHGISATIQVQLHDVGSMAAVAICRPAHHRRV